MAASAAQQGDDPAVVAVAPPDAEVLAVFVAIDDSTTKLAVEEDAEAVAADGGHRAEPFVGQDDGGCFLG